MTRDLTMREGYGSHLVLSTRSFPSGSFGFLKKGKKKKKAVQCVHSERYRAWTVS